MQRSQDHYQRIVQRQLEMKQKYQKKYISLQKKDYY